MAPELDLISTESQMLNSLKNELSEVAKKYGYGLDAGRALNMGALRPLPRSVIDDSLASWDFICKQLRKRILENHFQAWIEPLRVLKFDRKRLLLQTESAFAKSWIQEHYSKVILEVLGEHCALAVDFRLELRSSLLRIS